MAEPVQRTVGGGCAMSAAFAMPPASPTAATARRGSRRWSMSMRASTACWKTRAKPAAGATYAAFPSWKTDPLRRAWPLRPPITFRRAGRT